MACDRFADDLRAHGAGADATPGLRAHLETCANCRKALARERALLAGIGRDLAEALRVEPSVEFTARIRERVTAEQPAPWIAGWRFALGAGSLVLVAGIILMVTLRTGVPGHVPRSTPRVNSQASVIAPVDRREAPAPLVTPHPAPSGDTGRSAGVDRQPIRVTGRLPATGYRVRAARPTGEPEVLVPPDQRLAIGRLLAMVRAGKLDEKAFPAPAQGDSADETPRVIPPIVVAELKVPPIEITAPASTQKHN